MAAFAVATLAILLLAVVWITSHPNPGGTQVKAEFEDAFPLLEGMNVRFNGAIAGSVRKIEVNDDGNADVLLQLNSGAPNPQADASASIRQQDITGDSYVAYQPGRAAEPLPEEGISTNRTIVAPRFDDLLDSFGYQQREGLRIVLIELGKALDRRGLDLNDAALQLRPALTEANKALGEVNQQNSVLRKFVRDSEDVTGQLASRSNQLAKMVDSLAYTVQTTAAKSDQLDRALEVLPETSRQAQTTLASLANAANEAEPLALEVASGAPQLRTSVERIGPFLDDVNVTLRDTQPTLALSRKALRAAEPSLRVAPDKLITGPFELAGGVGDLLKSLLGDKNTLRGLFGADAYGIGDSRLDDVGLGAVAVETGSQPGYPANYDPNRRFLRAALVPSCEFFGIPVQPNCLTDALATMRTEASTAAKRTQPQNRIDRRDPGRRAGGDGSGNRIRGANASGGGSRSDNGAAGPDGTAGGLDSSSSALLEFLFR